MGFKSGMTHIIRDVNKPGSKAHKKEICEPVTIIETPPMVVVGVVGYIKTPRGLRSLGTVFTEHLSEEVRRSFYKNWYRSKNRKAFTKYIKKYADGKKVISAELEAIKKHCSIVRVLCHTLIRKISGLGHRRAQLIEIQVNGGTVADKVDFAYMFFEKAVTIESIFQTNQTIDVISITKGKGTQGVLSRWGVTRLPRKTHRGLRKVACIGAWHPSAVKWTVARAGQKGFHHRTEINKKIYRIGKAGQDSHRASTDYDVVDKDISPMGGFPHYGIVNNDFLVLKGSVPGSVRRPVTLRHSLFPLINSDAQEQINLKFIDTSSKFGHGRFQTSIEKANFLHATKV
jgi:large subunit ribosomal protein L3e